MTIELKLGGKMKIVPLDNDGKAKMVEPTILEKAQHACLNFANQPTRFGLQRALKLLDEYRKEQGWSS